LILISAGPFEQAYVSGMQERRFGRLPKAAKADVEAMMDVLDQPEANGKDAAFERLGKLLLTDLDAYDPIPEAADNFGNIPWRYDIYQGVWPEVAELRRSGALLRWGHDIRCPVVAIHGDHDPHPPEGVSVPLSAVLKEFEFNLLSPCGHTPWIERQAKDEFYIALKRALRA
jgi:pimeloyl-ACP methyl ester carboxylesterase